MAFLKQHGVGSGVHYIANHTQPFFARYVTQPLPRAERSWREIVSLPLYPEMTDADVEHVIAAVRAFDAGLPERQACRAPVSSAG